MNAYLGIDTSCYTTSIALIGREGSLISDEREVLKVKRGDRGLRQAEGVFQHIKNTGMLFNKVKNLSRFNKIAAVCATSRPRPVEESYMPVFTVGENVAAAVSSALGVPLFLTSHQENHIAAGIWSAGGPEAQHFLALHLSGGTTELLKVSKGHHGYSISIIGGSTDISTGQFIDRVGVSMGLPFPCGPHMEKLAGGIGELPDEYRIKRWSDGLKMSFSGPETMAKRMQEKGVDSALVALSVFDCIAGNLRDVIDRACKSTGLNDVLLVGGVSSNRYIKGYLMDRLGCNLFFPQPEYCRDNAVGSALLARDAYIQI